MEIDIYNGNNWHTKKTWPKNQLLSVESSPMFLYRYYDSHERDFLRRYWAHQIFWGIWVVRGFTHQLLDCHFICFFPSFCLLWILFTLLLYFILVYNAVIIFDLPSHPFFPCSTLSCFILCCVVLCCVVLCCVVLCCVVLCCFLLSYFILCCVVLCCFLLSLFSYFQIASFESTCVLRLCQHRSFSTISPLSSFSQL